MRRQPDDPPLQQGPQHDAAMQQALARLQASRAFRGAVRHRALLQHLVERRLAGDTAALKESVLAVQVFGRSAAGFDPVKDSIVRVEARRLRARLASYHAGEGRTAPLRIELPVGSYLPVLVPAAGLPQAAEATRRARDLVERGDYFLRQPLSAASLQSARERFDEALRESPQSAAACVGLARTWLNLATGWYHDPALAGEHAAEALQQALAADPTLPMAHALLGVLQNQWQWDWPAAQRSFRRALDLAPEAAFVHGAWGSHLLMRGRLAEAEAAVLRARELDPLYVNARAHMVNLRLAQGRPADAQAEWAGLADLAPDSLSVHGLGAVLAMVRDDMPAALSHYRRACTLFPDYPGCWAHLAGAQALNGQPDAARRTLADLQQRFADRVMSPYVLAIVALRMGDDSQAWHWLDQARDQGDPTLLLAPIDPLPGRAAWHTPHGAAGGRHAPSPAQQHRHAAQDQPGAGRLGHRGQRAVVDHAHLAIEVGPYRHAGRVAQHRAAGAAEADAPAREAAGVQHHRAMDIGQQGDAGGVQQQAATRAAAGIHRQPLAEVAARHVQQAAAQQADLPHGAQLHAAPTATAARTAAEQVGATAAAALPPLSTSAGLP